MSIQPAPQMAAREWGLLICLSVLWGGSFFSAEVALRELPPLTVVFGRVAFAALALLAVLAATGRLRHLAPARWPAFAAMGLLNNILPFSLIVWGQTAISGGLASILNATTPLFTVLLAHVLTRDETLRPAKLAGVICGAMGVAVMTGLDQLQNPDGALWPHLAVLAAACSYACAGIYGRRFAGSPPLATACGQVTASTLLMAPLVALVDHPWTLAMPSAATWGAVIGMALLCTALSYVLYFRILAVAGATNLLLVTLLIPVSAAGLGMLVLGEQMQAHQFGGAAMIAGALLLVDGRLPHAAHRRLRVRWAAMSRPVRSDRQP